MSDRWRRAAPIAKSRSNEPNAASLGIRSNAYTPERQSGAPSQARRRCAPRPVPHMPRPRAACRRASGNPPQRTHSRVCRTGDSTHRERKERRGDGTGGGLRTEACPPFGHECVRARIRAHQRAAAFLGMSAQRQARRGEARQARRGRLRPSAGRSGRRSSGRRGRGCEPTAASPPSSPRRPSSRPPPLRAPASSGAPQLVLSLLGRALPCSRVRGIGRGRQPGERASSGGRGSS